MDETVNIRHLDDMDALGVASAMIEGFWGAESGLPRNLLRALAHSGGYVVGAYDGQTMVGTTVALRGVMDGAPILHSHITCTTKPGQGIGRALKQHQRAWAAAQGFDAVTWTFDPLVRRNAWFNLSVLDAVGVTYLPDHYGQMDDPINAGELSDRLFAWWPTTPPDEPVVEPRGGEPLLGIDDLDRPAFTEVEPDGGAAVYCVRVPEDIEGMRSVTPNRAKEWRQAVRRTMGTAMGLGYTATHMRDDGTYVLMRAD